MSGNPKTLTYYELLEWLLKEGWVVADVHTFLGIDADELQRSFDNHFPDEVT